MGKSTSQSEAAIEGDRGLNIADCSASRGAVVRGGGGGIGRVCFTSGIRSKYWVLKSPFGKIRIPNFYLLFSLEILHL